HRRPGPSGCTLAPAPPGGWPGPAGPPSPHGRRLGSWRATPGASARRPPPPPLPSQQRIQDEKARDAPGRQPVGGEPPPTGQPPQPPVEEDQGHHPQPEEGRGDARHREALARVKRKGAKGWLKVN